jgi:protoheme IX farnesyltransferase
LKSVSYIRQTGDGLQKNGASIISAAPDFIALMKPYIMLLVALTGATSLVLERSLFKAGSAGGWWRFALILAGLLLSGGSANAFNMYLERNIDAKMARTKDRRPLPQGRIEPLHALIFAILIGILGTAIFAVFFNLLSAILALLTILFYSFFYTLYLKPRTPYNIVIGGAAGSMAPIIAWSAVAGNIALTPIMLSIIIFLWTPPHFWSLALYTRKDYELVNYPMMPIARGDRATRRQILIYVLLLILFSVICPTIGAGLTYAVIALAAGGILIYRAARLVVAKTRPQARGLFRFSIIYLLAIFIGLILDSMVGISL